MQAWTGSTDPAALKTFILAGNAVFTLRNRRSGNHITYRVRQAELRPGERGKKWFLSVLAGEGYAFIGIMGFAYDVNLSAKSLPASDPRVRVFKEFWAKVWAHKPTPGIEVHHQGRCGRCARPLTDPASIERGIGPDCAEMMGLSCT